MARSKHKGAIRRSFGSAAFDWANVLCVGLISLGCIFPFVYVFTFSITPYQDYLAAPLNIIPRNVTLMAYQAIFEFYLLRSGFKNTLLITLIGTALNIVLLVVSAYPLSKPDLRGRKVIMALIVFTMYFNGGLVPNYYIVRSLHLLNTLWALVLPGAISAYNLILMKNFIAQVPESLEESAVIDGASEWRVLLSIILPLSAPAIATFCLFHAVAHWNTFFGAVLYITRREGWPLMLVLREMIADDAVLELAQVQALDMEKANTMPFTLKMATIIVTILPIVLVYPFLQRYFMKGLLLGAVKG